MTAPVSTIEFYHDDQHLKLEVWLDPEPISPRDGVNMGVMLYNHRKYVLGDERITFNSLEDYLEDANIPVDEVVSLPLYMLDHSGLRMSVEDFNDPWDSGCVGAIYITHEAITAQYGDTSSLSIDRALQQLRDEVEEFDQFISGNVYGFRLMNNEAGRWEELDSVWGFYGTDVQTNGMLDHVSDDMQESIIAAIPTPSSSFKMK